MKMLVKLIGLVLVLFLVAGAAVVYFGDTLVQKGIEKGGETALGVPTRVGNVDLSLTGGEATMNQLTIANPPGFTAQQFLVLGQANMAVSLNSLLSDTVTIPRIAISGIRVNLEQKGERNNVKPLLERARSLAGEGSKTTDVPASASKEGGKKFIVTHFSLDDVQVNANLEAFGQNSSLNLVLPKIELRNLGDEQGGLTMPELIEKVVQVILESAQKSSGQLSPALARLLSGELSDLQSLQSGVIDRARRQVDSLTGDLEERLQLNVPEEDKKMIEERAGNLIKGLSDRLGGN
ncbi:hypothetical protein [Pelovirga terrestris]|uniref:AsmA domain-containing protein n=1 Tax=Pelovirga terrestris TaxID=2771352 RepID=A0A8J6QW16_9BACT|nr:hypothetical protein [Pelovirga terrestris]MBD1399456.1 hypothetical protein [Pelovirga terrestris]